MKNIAMLATAVTKTYLVCTYSWAAISPKLDGCAKQRMDETFKDETLSVALKTQAHTAQ